jgi:hypothetical protein
MASRPTGNRVSGEDISVKERAMSADVLDLPITSAAAEAEDSGRDEFAPLGPVICYRDPADVRTIRRQSWLIIISFVITAVAVVGVVYKSIQRLDRIVVDMSSGRTVMINDRELGATEAVRLEKDKLQIADMDYVVKAYLEYLYRADLLGHTIQAVTGTYARSTP